MGKLTILSSSSNPQLHRRPGRLSAPNHPYNLRPDRLALHYCPIFTKNFVFKALDGIEMTPVVEVLTDNVNVDRVCAVAVENASDETVGEYLFDLVCGRVGCNRSGR